MKSNWKVLKFFTYIVSRPNLYFFKTKMTFCKLVFIILFTCLNQAMASNVTVDEMGYIVYCPCMGRFGNQADHFLGALGFAKGLGRTLVLPPWVEYRYGEPKSIQVPFDTYFQIEPLAEYHKVITMENFMKNIASTIWPPEKRIAFCYVARGTENKGCNAKEGNPFGPFWDTFDIDFVGSEFYSPLHYDVHHSDMSERWNFKYNPKEWPVLAFAGAPASFPVQLENRDLHRYLKWNPTMNEAADEFIKTKLPKGGFIGIHLRNGIDWVRACEHIKNSPNLFAAPQCLGYRNELGHATQDMCFPSLDVVVKQLKRLLRNSKGVSSIFVASDSNHMLKELATSLKKSEVTVHKLDQSNPHLDLAILGRANYFIGNCISSFTAFAKRERDVRKFPSAFWGFPPPRSSGSHDEL